MARKPPEAFGEIEKLPSGRYRARYTGPDGKRHKAPWTFAGKGEARSWLAGPAADIAAGRWVHPDELAKQKEAAAAEAARKSVTVGDYAEQWITRRVNAGKLGARAAYDYRNMWRGPEPKRPGHRAKPAGRLHIWSDVPIGDVTRQAVDAWHDDQLASGKLTMVARVYDHLRTVMADAEDREVIDKNPCRIKGASKLATGRKRIPPTDDELATVIEAMPTHLRSLVVTAAATGLRFGELTALRGHDFEVEHDTDGAVVCVRVTVDAAVTYVPGVGHGDKAPKSAAGVRSVPVYGADALVIAAHLESIGDDDLLWSNAAGTGALSHASFTWHWDKARRVAGRPDLELHSLRHYHGTRYAQLSGATLAEIMARLGHSSVDAAMRYQHAGTRDDELARRAAR
ncbi:Site-specific recombinase XerD [Gordonia malaquae]|uniref:Putative integrase n=1 Tax=Gordonia malaquae NBRC 108250 TaxID=1223542 RepID=M3TBP8_GORML|nr:tyrosine-type recombinase/integrase [Gordonia malaquae]GAC78801.1 putative integrase [Gordonia malaquae NBRC 108250]SED66886.1 Site-specific recombinase XerD [Gordonia malaquae]